MSYFLFVKKVYVKITKKAIDIIEMVYYNRKNISWGSSLHESVICQQSWQW